MTFNFTWRAEDPSLSKSIFFRNWGAKAPPPPAPPTPPSLFNTPRMPNFAAIERSRPSPTPHHTSLKSSRRALPPFLFSALRSKRFCFAAYFSDSGAQNSKLTLSRKPHKTPHALNYLSYLSSYSNHDTCGEFKNLISLGPVLRKSVVSNSPLESEYQSF